MSPCISVLLDEPFIMLHAKRPEINSYMLPNALDVQVFPAVFCYENSFNTAFLTAEDNSLGPDLGLSLFLRMLL